MIAQVIVDISNSEVDRIFDYDCGKIRVAAGSRVLIPFGKREIEGYVIDLKETTDCPPEKLKTLVRALDPYPVIHPEMLELMRFMTERYHLRIVDVLRLFIPAQMRGGKVKELVKQFARIHPDYLGKDESTFIRPSALGQLDVYRYLCENESVSVTELNKNFSAASLKNLVMRGVVLLEEREVKRTPYESIIIRDDGGVRLTEAQQAVVDEVNAAQSMPFLLHGVTGSGKTEVYMHCIAESLRRGKSAIMLVPEISLTPQVLRNFRARFGENVALLHSGLSVGERYDEWRRILVGEAKVVIGARSAIFAPVTNLGVIIVDEEHDSSYISESNPRYVTSEVADFRMRHNACNMIMGSATPSIESYYRAQRGEYKLLELRERINKKALPEIRIVNMCNELYEGNNGIFSRELVGELHECIDGGNQAIIFINRRGYSSYVMCRSCGYVAKCAQCDVSLVYHRDENVLKCHYCNNRYAVLDICPECKSPNIKQGYVGTQRVVEQLQEMFPDKKILRMDNDTTQTKDAHAKILGEFAAKKASVLVGTQMIAKGHDFPDVTLVGIVDADMSLHFADYRSNERTFQLITQVAGRAGRDTKPGKVILQTYTPNHYVYRYAVNGDYKGFYDKECNLREVTKYPPFSKIVRLLVSSEEEDIATAILKKMFDAISAAARESPQCFAYLAAMRAPVKKIKNRCRVQILMRLTEGEDTILKKVYEIVDECYHPKASCFVEINPNNLS